MTSLLRQSLRVASYRYGFANSKSIRYTRTFSTTTSAQEEKVFEYVGKEKENFFNNEQRFNEHRDQSVKFMKQLLPNLEKLIKEKPNDPQIAQMKAALELGSLALAQGETLSFGEAMRPLDPNIPADAEHLKRIAALKEKVKAFISSPDEHLEHVRLAQGHNAEKQFQALLDDPKNGLGGPLPQIPDFTIDQIERLDRAQRAELAKIATKAGHQRLAGMQKLSAGFVEKERQLRKEAAEQGIPEFPEPYEPYERSVRFNSGLTGVPVVPNAREVLMGLYRETIRMIDEDYDGTKFYNNFTRKMCAYRLKICLTSKSDLELLDRVRSGTLEELITYAEDELDFLVEVNESIKPWEANVEEDEAFVKTNLKFYGEHPGQTDFSIPDESVWADIDMELGYRTATVDDKITSQYRALTVTKPILPSLDIPFPRNRTS